MKLEDKNIEINYTFSLKSLIKNSIIFGIMIILMISYYNKHNSFMELEELNLRVMDSLVISKNSNGEFEALIRTIETENTKTFYELQSKDSIIIDLQKEVKKNKKYLKNRGSVTNISSNTNIGIKTESEVIKASDSSFVYKSAFNLDGWVYGLVTAGKDSTEIHLKVKNDYTVVLGQEKTGFLNLGKGKSFVKITNKNPYSEVKSLRTYQVSPPKVKRMGVGPFLGATLSKDLSINPVIGVGINYQLIQF